LRRNVSCVLLVALNQLEVRFREISTDKIAPRLSAQLVRLSKQVGKTTSGEIEIRLSQADLARLTGTTIFTINRLLSRWEQEGILKTERQAVRVLNVSRLTELSQEQ
jgi:CRP-like cAMP-binding protein